MWDDVLNFAASIVFPIGRYKLSLLMMLQGILAIVLSLMVALWFGAFVERRLIASPVITTSLRVVLVRIFKVVLLIIALLFGLSIAGLDLTLFSVFGGALGVGLGLGLQKIASNYFSGFILLFERSLRLGDMLTVDKYYGRVTEIRNRYIVLQSLDGTETIIPNETLINNPVQNLSFSSKHVRLAERIVVGYDTDLSKIMPMMIEIAHAHPRVLQKPEAGVALLAFGENGFELEFGFWINDPEEGRSGVYSDINLEVWKMFKRENVTLPFPQRVLHTASGTLEKN
jgi:small-conductance mechanosensitive channel